MLLYIFMMVSLCALFGLVGFAIGFDQGVKHVNS